MLLLPEEILSLRYSAAAWLPEGVDASRLMLPAVLMLAGFGAKAGAFPLHVWLPRAYPAAPAPAAALLSAVLSKAGVFGILILSIHVMRDVPGWHALIFWVGIVTMIAGGLWALLSMNVMRVLAWSSMSQIGFILVGVGVYGLLSAQGGSAAQGLFGHMVNHSLFKMILFLCAGVAVMNVGKRHLNDLRGFGRGKPLLHFAFLTGMLGIAGVPLWSGFASKSLLHESLQEYIGLLSGGAWLYTAAEWLFVLAGGLTVAYMLKLYICLFWERPESNQNVRPYLSRATAAVILALSVFPLLMGVFPSAFLDGLKRVGADFFGTDAQAFAVFTTDNLLSAAKSIGIGLLLYLLVVRGLLSEKTECGRSYMNPVPAKINLEDMLYLPALRALEALVTRFSWAVSVLPEALIASLRRALLHVRAWRVPMPGGNRLTSGLGELLNGVAALLNKTLLKKHPSSIDFACALAAGNEELRSSMKRLKRSLSYSLLLFCIGLFGLLSYLIFV
jgi:NADH:ubiquinone oxidoreductase subunit 5 (subunit L)/multisubunit Na+/H+ antiporter MnhA subunit